MPRNRAPSHQNSGDSIEGTNLTQPLLNQTTTPRLSFFGRLSRSIRAAWNWIATSRFGRFLGSIFHRATTAVPSDSENTGRAPDQENHFAAAALSAEPAPVMSGSAASLAAVITTFSQKPVVSPDPAEGEVMPECLYKDVGSLISGYLGCDHNDMDLAPMTQGSKEKYQNFKLFGRSLDDLMGHEAAVVAKHILYGEEKDVNQALALIKAKPILLRVKTEVTDLLQRRVKGTLLQIAAMVGDVDLRPGISDQKDCGMVERLIAAGNLPQEEVIEQLQVITSKEAQEENEARNQHILDAIIKFGSSICELKAEKNESLAAFQARCEPLVTQLEKKLQPDAKRVITSGYMFDLKILQQAVRWFEDHVNQFDGWCSIQSNVFWVNSFEKLQSKLSSRDTQVINAGIGKLVHYGDLPARTLDNAPSWSRFYDGTGRFKRIFHLGAYATTENAGIFETRASVFRGCLEDLMSSKNRSIASLCNAPTIGRGLSLA